MNKSVSGFSKLSKAEKIAWLSKTYLKNATVAVDVLKQYWNPDAKLQQLHDEFTENTVSNFYLPFGIAPNFVINERSYAVPMVVEESSVIAAASKAAKFWAVRGGFKTKVLGTKKTGQVHFMFPGKKENLISFFNHCRPKMLEQTQHISKNMEKRGGGIVDIELKDKTRELPNYYQLHATFETLDAMGANFINSCLEQFGKTFEFEAQKFPQFSAKEKQLRVVMAILSNYVPECLVRAEVSCPVEEFSETGIDGKTFAEKFIQAIKIAEIEPIRAVTHNKGIMNGVDAVVLATGNDFRAVEAGVHAFAAKEGKYTSLTHAKVENGIFYFWIEIPLALGTVGGLTNLHPLVKAALEILQRPSAKELMEIAAAAGLAQNFAAVKSLVTTGIQKGHMKMHLLNMLNQYQATDVEKATIIEQFETRPITHSAVVKAIEELRQ